MVRILEMARDWALGCLAFGVCFVSAVLVGTAAFLVVLAVLPKRVADGEDDR